MNNQLQQTGRVIFAIPMAVFGIEHFLIGEQMAGMVPSYIPGGIFWVYLTGAALLAAAISIISRKWIWWSSVLLFVLLLLFALTIHLPGLFNAQSMQMSMISLLKDLSLAGAALYVAGSSKP